MISRPRSSGRFAPDVGLGTPVSDSRTVPSMSVVPGSGPGVLSVRTPHVTSAGPKVLVQVVVVGPVSEPWR